jgi:hypothetical protein
MNNINRLIKYTRRTVPYFLATITGGAGFGKGWGEMG